MTLTRPFWRMTAATASSDLADGVARTVLPLAAALYTRNPLTISALATFSFLPWLLFALPSGALVDRVDRRYAMAGANLVRAGAAVGLALLVYTRTGGVAALYALAFVLGMAETVYDSGVRALLPQIVERADLDRANSIITVEETLGQTFLGSPLGSLLFAAAVAVPFVLGAAGFGLAVALIITLRGRYRPVRAPGPVNLRADMVEGIRWLRGHQFLRRLTLISAGTACANQMSNAVLVLYVLEVLRLPVGDYGLVLLLAGVGAVVGSALTPPLSRRFGRPALLMGGAIVTAVATGLMATTRNGYVGASLYAAAAAGVMVWNVLTMSMRQALIPSELFGRVQGAYRTLVWGGIPLGALAGGGIAEAFGVRTAFAVSGSLMLLVGVVRGWLVYRHAGEVAEDQLSTSVATPA